MKQTTTNVLAKSNYYDLNAVNKFAASRGIKPLTLEQFKSMKKREVKRYLNAGAKVAKLNTKQFKSRSKVARKNAKTVATEEFKQKQLLHGTIRHGMAQLGTIASEAIVPAMAGHLAGKFPAISQNVSGGVQEHQDEGNGYNDDTGMTEHGPVRGLKRYSSSRRDED